MEEDGAMTIKIYDRKRVYILPDREAFYKDIVNKAKLCAVTISKKKKGNTLASVMKEREFVNNDFVVARFDIYKNSPRHTAPVKRVMQITENSLLELDPESFVITSMIPLNEITHLIRCFDEPQLFLIEFKNRPTRRYSCSSRDALLGALLDICRMQGFSEAMMQVVESHPGIKIRTVDADNMENMEKTCLQALEDASGVSTTQGGQELPYTPELFNAVCEFNSNVNGSGPLFVMKEKKLFNFYLAIFDQIVSCLKDTSVSEKIPAAMFETLYRLLLRTELPYYVMQTEGVMELIKAALNSGKEGVVFWTLEFLRIVVLPFEEERNEELESANKAALLGDAEFRDLLMKLLDTYAYKPTGTIVVLSLMEFLECVLSGYSNTTDPEVKEEFLEKLSQRHSILLSLFHSNCSGVTTSTALIMKTIVEESQNEVAQLMQEAALSEGVLLQHFYNAVYSTSEDQRYISRYLVGLWMGEHEASRALLKRMVPIGIQRFLNKPALTDKEIEKYQQEENARMEENSDLKPSRATSRLRSRIQASKRDGNDHGNFPLMFFMMLHDHSTYTVIWNHETRNELKSALEKELNALKQAQDKVPEGEPKPLWNHEEFFIDYKSLKDEIVIDGFYISKMVDQDSKVKLSIEKPSELFQAMYTRMLREVDYANKILCVKAMTVLYDAYINQIGSFYETRQILELIDTTDHRTYRDHLIVLFNSLLKYPGNVDIILRDLDSCADIIMDLLSMAHTASDTELRVSSILQNSIVQSGLLLTAGPAKSGKKSKKEESKKAKKEVKKEEPAFIPMEAVPDPDFGEDVPLGGPGMTLPPGMAAPDPDFGDDIPLGGPGVAVPMGVPMNAPDPDFDLPTNQPEPEPEAEAAAPAEEKKEEEGIAEWWYLSGHEKIEKGPVTISRLSTLLKRGLITPTTEVRSEQGDYKPLNTIRQLRWQLLMEGTSYLEPIACALTILEIVNSILNRHSSYAADNILKTPIPRAKRVFGQRKYLAYIAQLMLVNNPTIVETAAETLDTLVANNEDAMNKLYLTGVFFFALAYSGSNYLKISKLLWNTHLKQHFRTSADSLTSEVPICKRSILGTILPESMICLLDNYGPEEFTKKLLGNFDTPEVIWKYEMRKHMVEEVLKHIGDFGKKLRENPTLLFDYGPIPQVKYPELEEEMWCHNYYIAALCDEKRFNNWPIKKPVELLRAVLDRWRIENTKQAPGVSEEEAYAILGFGPDVERPDENTLKKEYRKLARKYHPDKNPEGRETFEKIQKAFELLSNTRTRTGGPDPVNILLILKAQRIIYKRFPEKLAAYKYAGYEFLLPLLQLKEDEMLTVEKCPQLEVASSLLYYTCECTPYNCKEFIHQKGIEVVAQLINRCTIVPDTPSDDPRIPVGENLMHTIGYAAGLEEGRAVMETLSYLPTDIARYPLMLQSSRLVQYGLEAIANAALSADLQNKLLNCTTCVLWSVLPLLFRFDPSLENNDMVEMEETAHSQAAANNNCKRAALALTRLGGYSSGEVKAPRNKEIRKYLACLLTPPVAALLAQENPVELLTILNTRKEVPRLIWTNEMRDQLLESVNNRIHDQGETGNTHLEMASDFVFDAIKDELIVGDVYVRIYNNQNPKNFERADEFCEDLFDYLHEQREGEVDELGMMTGKYEPKCKNSFIQMTLKALMLVLTNTKDLALTITKPTALDDLFAFIQPDENKEYEETDRLRDAAFEVLKIVTPLAPCAKVIVKEEQIQWLLKMLYTDCFPTRLPVLDILTRLCETSDAVAECRRLSVPLVGLWCICREQDQVGAQYRMAAARLLNRMCNDEKEGAKVIIELRRFIPFVLVMKIKDQHEIFCSQFDSEHETPEIIWTGHMRGQLRETVDDYMDQWNKALWEGEEFEVPRSFHMSYPELNQELFVGGIYIRLFLKDPKFPLRDPKSSLEGCLNMFFVESKYELSRLQGKEVKRNDDEEKFVDATQPENLKDNILSTITSGIACLLKSQPTLCEHVAMLDYPKKLVATLKVSAKLDPRGDLTTSIIRIMHDVREYR